jgi:glutamine synthetase type III
MRGDTIHVPCVFISWTGHALDYKTPLLRAEQVTPSISASLLSSRDVAHEDLAVMPNARRQLRHAVRPAQPHRRAG